MRFPNSTTATKLLPLVPYQRFVPGFCEAPNEASDPHLFDVKPTGLLGALSSNGESISGEMRWNRFTCPHGIDQPPKSRRSRETARSKASSFSFALSRSMCRNILSWSFHVRPVTSFASSSPQKFARVVGTDATDQRPSQFLKGTIGCA